MNRNLPICLMLLAGCQFSAVAAAAAAPAESYAAAKKAAASRYAEDKKLCADETTSSARMQCLRDAKVEYIKALAEAKKLKDGAAKSSAAEACTDCGTVLSVKAGEKEGKGGPVGVIAGGVAGAVLGHQVGGGTGKDLATVAGAAGGAYAGHKIEQKMTATKYWAVRVQLDSGKEATYTFDHDPGFAAGDPVMVKRGTIVRRAN